MSLQENFPAHCTVGGALLESGAGAVDLFSCFVEANLLLTRVEVYGTRRFEYLACMIGSIVLHLSCRRQASSMRDRSTSISYPSPLLHVLTKPLMLCVPAVTKIFRPRNSHVPMFLPRQPPLQDQDSPCDKPGSLWREAFLACRPDGISIRPKPPEAPTTVRRVVAIRNMYAELDCTSSHRASEEVVRCHDFDLRSMISLSWPSFESSNLATRRGLTRCPCRSAVAAVDPCMCSMASLCETAHGSAVLSRRPVVSNAQHIDLVCSCEGVKYSVRPDIGTVDDEGESQMPATLPPRCS